MPETSETVKCVDLLGNIVFKPKSRVEFRPSAYGIILHERKILLCTMKQTGKLCLPGGGVEIGEMLVETVARETREECGIDVKVDTLAAFQEHFFYYEPEDEVFQVHGFLFLASPLSFDVTDKDAPSDEISNDPRWIPVDSLKADQFQVFGEKVMNVLQHQAATLL